MLDRPKLTDKERRQLRRHTPAQETLDRVTALLVAGASFENAFAMGVVCATAWARGYEPSLEALDRLAGEQFIDIT
jgi:hypothetical protein